MSDAVRIKPEPEAGSPLVEDDLDESADLEFYDPSLQGPNSMYLARLPNYVWQAWSKLGDDEEIEIGKIRQWTEADGSLKLQMLLSPNVEEHKSLPKEYNMQVVNPDVHNTFIFTEQDLPSYASKNKQRAAALAQGIPSHLLRQQQKPSENSQPRERGKRGLPYTRRAIPKKTTIAGTVRHEVVCTPLPNAETDEFLSQLAFQSQKKQTMVQLHERLPPNGVSDEKEWESFIKTSEKPTKAKKMENKTARWPENQLIDELIKCFSTHKYWSIKALRGKIPQPEAFIRQCLEKLAHLHRHGPFANNWQLLPAFQSMIPNDSRSQPVEEAAAPNPDVDIASDDEEDEDVKMEDVL